VTSVGGKGTSGSKAKGRGKGEGVVNWSEPHVIKRGRKRRHGQRKKVSAVSTTMEEEHHSPRHQSRAHNARKKCREGGRP